MAETTEDQKKARKAYGDAMSILRENHRSEFEALLAEQYAALGVVRRRRATADEIAARKAAKEAEKAAKAEAKRLARVASLEAELRLLTGAEAAPVDPATVSF